MDPALGADIRRGQQHVRRSARSGRCYRAVFKLLQHFRRRLERHRRFPCPDRPMIQRRIVGERLVGNIRDQLAMVQNAQPRFGDHLCPRSPHPVPTSRRPAVTSSSRFLSATSSMRSWLFGQHHLVRRHAGFALRNLIQFHLKAHAAARAHLAGGAGQSGCAHILNADDRRRCASPPGRLRAAAFP